MKLLLDLGNSRLKWCLAAAEDRFSAVRAVAVERDIEQCIRGVRATIDVMPDSIVVSSVAGRQATRLMSDLILQQFDMLPRMAGVSAVHRGLVNGYRQPSRLGIDRWLAMIGARLAFPGKGVLVVDAGSALTVDAVRRDGRHLGGLIVPGLTMQSRMLLQSTAIDAVDESRGTGLSWGLDTEEAISHGISRAMIALIESSWSELRRDGDEAVVLVLTGGDGATLSGMLSVPSVVDDYLVFRGLWEWARMDAIDLH